MRKAFVLLTMCLVLVGTQGAFAEIEIGAGVSPPLMEMPKDMPQEAAGPLGNTMISFHGGFSFWWLFYASADSYILPPFVVKNMTTTFSPELGYVVEGQYRPGMLNLINVGFRPKIGPLAVTASVGVNNLYIYKQDELDQKVFKPSLGVNLRLGLYLFLNKVMAITATGTTVFQSPEGLIKTLEAIGGENQYLREKAIDYVMGNLYPTIGLILNL